MAATKKATQGTTTDTGSFDAMTMGNPEAFKQGYEKITENMSAFADFNKNSMDAMMESAGAFSKGFEKLASEQSAFIKSSLEKGVEVAKSASSANSIQEAFDIQSEFVRESVERNMGQASKVSEMMADTTKEVVAPISERYSELVEKIQAYRP